MTPNKNKNNYNNNEHKQNTTNGENYLFMGASIRLLQVETKICHHGPSTMPQYSSLTFAIAFKDHTNKSLLMVIANKHDNSSQLQGEKHC